MRQLNPPLSPRQTLPTMYDLPSDNPEEPGLPDEYHDLQPHLLSRTCCPRLYPAEERFTGTNMNIYYDVRHPLWYKRPDWFLVVGVPRLYDDVDLRNSYVVWQEGVNPFVVVEFLSPGTAKEDLGHYAQEVTFQDTDDEPEPTDRPGNQLPIPVVIANKTTPDQDSCNGSNGKSTTRSASRPLSKWQVYEQTLRIPYYIVFSRYTDRLWFFKLVGGRYQKQTLDSQNPQIWVPELEIGLGLWQGSFEGINRRWLRWYDSDGNWILTDTEQERERAEQERERAEQERERAERIEAENRQLREYLRSRGLNPDQLGDSLPE